MSGDPRTANQVVLPEPIGLEGRLYVTHAAGRTNPDAVEAGMERLRALGYSVSSGTDIAAFHSTDGPAATDRYAPVVNASADYLAGPDVLRVRDLTHALTAPDVDAVIAARGGYGCMRILERLPWGLLAEQPRWLMGYSDITALHLWAYAQGVASIHGPMAAGLGKHDGDGSLQGLAAALAGHPAALKGVDAAWAGTFEGPLVGGNLSMLAALRPTRFWPSLDGVILFIEEVNEPLYRIDRMLQTLKLAGGLERVAGFAIGQLAGCGSPTDPADPTARREAESRALDVVVERLGSLRKPIVVGLPVGHDQPNASFIHGARYHCTGGLLRCVQSRESSASASPWLAKRKPVDAAARPLTEAIASGVCSGAQLYVSEGGKVTHNLAIGVTAMTGDAAQAPVTTNTLFDVASVTKAVSTAVLAHRAIELGLLTLDATCPAEISVSTPTLRDLLRHTSGLPAYERVWHWARRAPDARKFALKRFTNVAVDANRTGTQVYSDVGYIALGRWLESVFDTSLDALFETHIATPISLGNSVGYGVHTDNLSRVAATEICPFRGGALQGTVHDENAQVLGGACGHAGLFATAEGVGKIAESLLGYGPAVLQPESVAAMWDVGPRVETYTLGWDTPSGARSNAGSVMDREATVGHLGFTGTSVWVDRARNVVIALNTNRVHPHRDNAGIRWVRPAIHDAVMRELGYR